MRIIGGAFRSARLDAPPGRGTRPTTDRVREALFNLLAARMSFEGAHVLDLFAGSGALGLEALSRGAAQATFVERDRKALATLRANADRLGVAAQCHVVGADAEAFLAKSPRSAPFGLAFADPPYELSGLPELPRLVRPHLREDALFALEHDARHAFEADPSLVVSRPYGQTVVSIFRAA